MTLILIFGFSCLPNRLNHIPYVYCKSIDATLALSQRLLHPNVRRAQHKLFFLVNIVFSKNLCDTRSCHLRGCHCWSPGLSYAARRLQDPAICLTLRCVPAFKYSFFFCWLFVAFVHAYVCVYMCISPCIHRTYLYHNIFHRPLRCRGFPVIFKANRKTNV